MQCRLSTPLMTISRKAGIINEMDIGMNNSSKDLAVNINLEPVILSSNTSKNNLTTTSTVRPPNTKPKIRFNSDASILTSREGFGDSCSSLVIHIIQEKFLALMCKHILTKHVIVFSGYADNYNGSFRTVQGYSRLVKEDMESTHRKIGLPLKHT